MTREIQIQCIQLIREGFPRLIASKMVLVHKDMQISTLEDIQKLKAKDLKEILRSNSETTGGTKADRGREQHGKGREAGEQGTGGGRF